MMPLDGKGECLKVVGRGSWVPSRGSCVVGTKSWVVSRGYQVVGTKSWVINN